MDSPAHGVSWKGQMSMLRELFMFAQTEKSEINL